MSETDDQRGSGERLEAAQAHAVLDAVNADPTLLRISQAYSQLSPLRQALARVHLRLGCLSSFTFDPITPSLGLQGLRAGIAIGPHVGGYGQFEQELIDPASALARFQPDVVLLAIRLQDVCPAFYEDFGSLTPSSATTTLDDWFDRLAAVLDSFRSRSQASVLMQNYGLPAYPTQGIADRQGSLSQTELILEANRRLRELAASHQNVYVMDYDALVARHGRRNWTDARTELYARIPIASDHYWHLAGFYVRHLRPLLGLTRKVLVLDADNTLWGGVIGDAGLHGIELGHDFPGNAYVLFQKRILDLYHRGVVLALASKNEPGSVEEVLKKHPNMILRPDHFATTRINRDPKPKNLRQMANDLNLGLDSFVFIDDSPVECEMMRTALSQVLTVQLPKDPARYPGVIETLDCFDQWNISEEDRKRGSLYKAEADRRVFKTTTLDLPTFYRQLEMVMTPFVNCEAHTARAAQMTNRTNQFNMHTIRCSEDDVKRFLASENHEVITLALKDRFGDNGIIGLAVVRREQDTWTLILFLMSCRVLGRTVEQSFVRWIAERAKNTGANQLAAEFAPTAKNKPFSGFFRDCGFTPAGSSTDVQLWVWELATADIAMPDWIEIAYEE